LSNYSKDVFLAAARNQPLHLFGIETQNDTLFYEKNQNIFPTLKLLHKRKKAACSDERTDDC
jgi:predicted ribosome-associated RNA-binding protein Tma20